jgi:uncharacterized lipoprotein YddW (UPF0748 family)
MTRIIQPRRPFLSLACSLTLLVGNVAGGQTATAEGRALWVTRFDFDSEAKIAYIMETAAKAHFNIIYFQVHAYLNALTGQAAGIEGQCRQMTEPLAGNPRHILLEHPEWAMSDARGHRLQCPNGEEYVWLSPGFPAVRTRLARVAADIARRYDVDGIHLDRIRYPGTAWSYDAASLAEFGRDPIAYPAAWLAYRTDLVSRMVKETYDSVTAVKSSLVLSAAVWGVYDDKWNWKTQRGLGDLMQDPRKWAKSGYLDVLVPMTYFRIKPVLCERADWTCLLFDHVEGGERHTGRQMYIGIDASKGADQIVKQIGLAREGGATGMAVFSFSAADSVGVWPLLAAGVFAQQAAVPPMPWKALLAGRVTVGTNH